jgi:hypothetical protein
MPLFVSFSNKDDITLNRIDDATLVKAFTQMFWAAPLGHAHLFLQISKYFEGTAMDDINLNNIANKIRLFCADIQSGKVQSTSPDIGTYMNIFAAYIEEGIYNHCMLVTIDPANEEDSPNMLIKKFFDELATMRG